VEYIAATNASTQALWLAQLLGDLLGRDAVELRVDNKSALALAKNPVFHECSKHIRVKYHFLKAAWTRGVSRPTTSIPRISSLTSSPSHLGESSSKSCSL
jgi:hypothetical protein